MSIYRKIQVIFLVSLVFTTLFFLSYFYILKKNNIEEKQKRYVQMAFMMENIYINRQIDLYDKSYKYFFDESDFILIESKKDIDKIVNETHSEFDENISKSSIKMLRNYGTFYMHITHPNYSILLEDTKERPFLKYILLVYLLFIIFIVLHYLWLIRSFKPLKLLHTQIKGVIDGDLTVSLKSDKSDEVAQVANAFDDALRKLESLINSRQLFLRAIMHELKTPISKGKFLNEFLEDEKQKTSYAKVFDRLTLLIEEFSKVEKMLSSSYVIKSYKCNAIDIVEHTLELMMLSNEEIEQKVELVENGSCYLHTDFELLSLAIKNLIDNAIKYSTHHQVKIVISSDTICILNKAEQFTTSLESYKQPFNEKSNGLGLGLYIVDNIVTMLKLNLEYTYDDGENIFKLHVKQ